MKVAGLTDLMTDEHKSANQQLSCLIRILLTVSS